MLSQNKKFHHNGKNFVNFYSRKMILSLLLKEIFSHITCTNLKGQRNILFPTHITLLSWQFSYFGHLYHLWVY